MWLKFILPFPLSVSTPPIPDARIPQFLLPWRQLLFPKTRAEPGQDLINWFDADTFIQIDSFVSCCHTHSLIALVGCRASSFMVREVKALSMTIDCSFVALFHTLGK